MISVAICLTHSSLSTVNYSWGNWCGGLTDWQSCLFLLRISDFSFLEILFPSSRMVSLISVSHSDVRWLEKVGSSLQYSLNHKENWISTVCTKMFNYLITRWNERQLTSAASCSTKPLTNYSAVSTAYAARFDILHIKYSSHRIYLCVSYGPQITYYYFPKQH